MQKTFLYMTSFILLILAILMQIDLITALLNLIHSPKPPRGLILLGLVALFETQVNAWYFIDHAFWILGISLMFLILGILFLLLASRRTKRPRRYSF